MILRNVYLGQDGGLFFCKCDVCGKEFRKGYDSIRHSERVRTDACSDQCAYVRDLKKQRDKREQARKRKCLNCGKVFTPARNDAKFCCNACKQETYRVRKIKSLRKDKQ